MVQVKPRSNALRFLHIFHRSRQFLSTHHPIHGQGEVRPPQRLPIESFLAESLDRWGLPRLPRRIVVAHSFPGGCLQFHPLSRFEHKHSVLESRALFKVSNKKRG